jgi:hypothetical protein
MGILQDRHHRKKPTVGPRLCLAGRPPLQWIEGP